MNTYTVLDHGYVRLVDVMGNDLSVVNAARVSFAKESHELTESDARLLHYLAQHGHFSPFRHAFLSFEIVAPLIVARQWWKYVVGSDHIMDGWNEVSRRYVTLEPEFYQPDNWRLAPENRKQGSAGPAEESVQESMKNLLQQTVDDGLARYEQALALGIAPEQARLLLPAYAMYTAWRWSASLQSVAHFLAQRLADEAQVEIQHYARAVHQLTLPHFPNALAALIPS